MKQFGEFTKNVIGGGDSVHVWSGERPQTGYMVSLPGREQRTPLEHFGIGQTLAYNRRHTQDLTNREHFLGGWAHEGQAYLDVSRRVPTAEEAVTTGWRNNQLAVHKNEDHTDIDVPDSPRDLPIWRNYRRLPS